jgi:hypothetical protein
MSWLRLIEQNEEQRLLGSNRQLNQFDNFFTLNLLYQVLSRAETVNVALQKMHLNYFQSQMMLSDLKDTIAGMRKNFDSFWTTVT